MLARIVNLANKEFIQFIRDRFFAVFIFIFPILQLILLAQATSRGWTHLPTAVWDQDRSALSRQLITALDVTEELDVLYYPQNLQDANDLIDQGKASLVVIIPAGFARDLTQPTEPAQLQVIADGSNNLVGGTALNAAEGVAADFARKLAGATIAVASLPVDLRFAVRFNPALNSQHQAIPSYMAFIIYQVTLAVSATALARERELGTLEQLAVTPLGRIELITGKAMPAAFLGIFDFVLMLALLIYWFHIPVRGSLWLLSAVTLLFIAAEIGWGVMISAFSRTQQQAILLVFIIAMTDVSLSGYMVPVKNMPSLLQTVSLGSAVRHYLAALRAITLKGAGLEIIWPEMLALAVIALVVGLVAMMTVQRRLD
jgi:ABC-2 type transport system permease protein